MSTQTTETSVHASIVVDVRIELMLSEPMQRVAGEGEIGGRADREAIAEHGRKGDARPVLPEDHGPRMLILTRLHQYHGVARDRRAVTVPRRLRRAHAFAHGTRNHLDAATLAITE